MSKFFKFFLAICVVFATNVPIAQALHGSADEYEPCHLLCSMEPGRFNPTSEEQTGSVTKWAYRISASYVKVLGHFENDRYEAIPDDARVTVIQLLPTITYRWSDLWTISGGLPYEYNRSKGVVLPTLHEHSEETSELAAGGLWFAARRRVKGFTERNSRYFGVGFRLSSEIGTTDVSDDLDEHPDKGIEALGIGSDDFFVSVAEEFNAESGARNWVELEYRWHVLPHWQRLFASTSSYLYRYEYPFNETMRPFFRLSGFYTYIPSMKVIQANLATPGAGIIYNFSEASSLDASVSGQVPQKKPINRNSLRTYNFQLGYSARI